ncbi:hypothetical protein ACTFIY_005419 [Dictyostelium cf. discoideum]
MKKFNQTFSSVKDLIGNKKETLTEFPDYIYKTKSLEDLKGYTRTLNLKLTKHSKTNQLLIEENKQLSEQILLYSNLFINNEESSLNVCEPLSNVFRIVGEMINEIENYRQTFEQSISQKWLQQLNEYGKSDCKDGQLAKNRFDKARLSFDEASEQFKQLRKKQNNINNEKLLEAEEDLDYATQQFSDIASESLQTMDDIIVKHNIDSFESANSTIQSYKDFFQKGLDHCLSIQSDLEIQKQAMSKYKQQLSEKKKLRSTVVQFEQTNSSRTISLPPPPPPKPSSSSSSSTPSSTPSSPSPSPSSSVINIHNNYVANPKGNTKVFGMSLSTITEREKSDIPMIIDKSIQFLLLEENITQEGIFRVSPNQKQLTDLKNNVNAGYITTLDGIDDAHLISSFVKAFLREMPIPLFTFDLYHSLVDCVINEEKYDCDKIKISNAIVLVLQKLPKPNFLLAKSLISLLWKISTKSSQNKMTTSNLAVTVAPNVLYPKLLDIRSLTNANATIEFIISNFNNIFNNQLISNLYNNSGGSGASSSGNSNGGGVANPRHSVLPPSLPARPQSVMFKNTPLSVNTSSQSSSSSSSSSFASSASPPPTPTKPPSSPAIITTTSPNSNTNINSNTSVNTNINPRHSVLPPSLPPKKISSSSNSLPPPPPPSSSSSSSSSIPEKSQNNITPTILSSSLSAPTSPTTTTTTNPLRSSTGSPKPISNRVSMYLQNSNTVVPQPSQKPQRVINNNNTNTTTTNSRPLSNSLDLPPPLAPVGMPLETLEPIQRNLTPNEDIIISEVNWN